MSISDVTSPEGRPRVLGYVSGVWGIAAIIGPLLGSFFVGTLGWPFVFWVNLPVGLLTTALVARYLHEAPPAGRTASLDLLGAGLLALGIGAIMAALVQHDSFSAPSLVGLIAVGLLALAGFAVRERQASLPILPLHLWRNPMLAAGNLSALLCGMLLIGATAFLPSWTEGVMGRSPLAAGIVLGILTVSWTTASIGVSRFMGRLPYRPVALAGSACLLVGSAGFALLRPDWAVGWVALAGSVTGIGLGLHALVFNVAVQTGTAREDRGRATSLYFFCRLLGQALGAAAFGGVLNAGLTRAGPAAHDAVRDLIEPTHRLALPPDALAGLTGALGSAMHNVFLMGLAVAAATFLAVVLVPRGARLATGR